LALNAGTRSLTTIAPVSSIEASDSDVSGDASAISLISAMIFASFSLEKMSGDLSSPFPPPWLPEVFDLHGLRAALRGLQFRKLNWR
jgi:hypothetical protein